MARVIEDDETRDLVVGTIGGVLNGILGIFGGGGRQQAPAQPSPPQEPTVITVPAPGLSPTVMIGGAVALVVVLLLVKK